jgi:hypothetical protein
VVNLAAAQPVVPEQAKPLFSAAADQVASLAMLATPATKLAGAGSTPTTSATSGTCTVFAASASATTFAASAYCKSLPQRLERLGAALRLQELPLAPAQQRRAAPVRKNPPHHCRLRECDHPTRSWVRHTQRGGSHSRQIRICSTFVQGAAIRGAVNLDEE